MASDGPPKGLIEQIKSKKELEKEQTPQNKGPDGFKNVLVGALDKKAEFLAKKEIISPAIEGEINKYFQKIKTASDNIEQAYKDALKEIKENYAFDDELSDDGQAIQEGLQQAIRDSELKDKIESFKTKSPEPINPPIQSQTTNLTPEAQTLIQDVTKKINDLVKEKGVKGITVVAATGKLIADLKKLKMQNHSLEETTAKIQEVLHGAAIQDPTALEIVNETLKHFKLPPRASVKEEEKDKKELKTPPKEDITAKKKDPSSSSSSQKVEEPEDPQAIKDTPYNNAKARIMGMASLAIGEIVGFKDNFHVYSGEFDVTNNKLKTTEGRLYFEFSNPALKNSNFTHALLLTLFKNGVIDYSDGRQKIDDKGTRLKDSLPHKDYMHLIINKAQFEEALKKNPKLVDDIGENIRKLEEATYKAPITHYTEGEVDLVRLDFKNESERNKFLADFKDKADPEDEPKIGVENGKYYVIVKMDDFGEFEYLSVSTEEVTQKDTKNIDSDADEESDVDVQVEDAQAEDEKPLESLSSSISSSPSSVSDSDQLEENVSGAGLVEGQTQIIPPLVQAKVEIVKPGNPPKEDEKSLSQRDKFTTVEEFADAIKARARELEEKGIKVGNIPSMGGIKGNKAKMKALEDHVGHKLSNIELLAAKELIGKFKPDKLEVTSEPKKGIQFADDKNQEEVYKIRKDHVEYIKVKDTGDYATDYIEKESRRQPGIRKKVADENREKAESRKWKPLKQHGEISRPEVPKEISKQHQLMSDILSYTEAYMSRHMEMNPQFRIKFYKNEAISELQMPLFDIKDFLKKNELPPPESIAKLSEILKKCPIEDDEDKALLEKISESMQNYEIQPTKLSQTEDKDKEKIIEEPPQKKAKTDLENPMPNPDISSNPSSSGPTVSSQVSNPSPIPSVSGGPPTTNPKADVGALLGQITGFQQSNLKKVKTVDKSGPILEKTSKSPETPKDKAQDKEKEKGKVTPLDFNQELAAKIEQQKSKQSQVQNPGSGSVTQPTPNLSLVSGSKRPLPQAPTQSSAQLKEFAKAVVDLANNLQRPPNFMSKEEQNKLIEANPRIKELNAHLIQTRKGKGLNPIELDAALELVKKFKLESIISPPQTQSGIQPTTVPISPPQISDEQLRAKFRQEAEESLMRDFKYEITGGTDHLFLEFKSKADLQSFIDHYQGDNISNKNVKDNQLKIPKTEYNGIIEAIVDVKFQYHELQKKQSSTKPQDQAPQISGGTGSPTTPLDKFIQDITAKFPSQTKQTKESGLVMWDFEKNPRDDSKFFEALIICLPDNKTGIGVTEGYDKGFTEQLRIDEAILNKLLSEDFLTKVAKKQEELKAKKEDPTPPKSTATLVPPQTSGVTNPDQPPPDIVSSVLQSHTAKLTHSAPTQQEPKPIGRQTGLSISEVIEFAQDKKKEYGIDKITQLSTNSVSLEMTNMTKVTATQKTENNQSVIDYSISPKMNGQKTVETIQNICKLAVDADLEKRTQLKREGKPIGEPMTFVLTGNEDEHVKAALGDAILANKENYVDKKTPIILDKDGKTDITDKVIKAAEQRQKAHSDVKPV